MKQFSPQVVSYVKSAVDQNVFSMYEMVERSQGEVNDLGEDFLEAHTEVYRLLCCAEQALNIYKAAVFEHFLCYEKNLVAEQKSALSADVVSNHDKVMNTINALRAFKGNLWWMPDSLKNEVKKNKKSKKSKTYLNDDMGSIDFQKSLVYHQIIRVGINNAIVVPRSILLNCMNNILNPRGYVVYSIFFRLQCYHDRIFEELNDALTSDADFMEKMEQLRKLEG